jgi:hypothetical protein
LAFDVPFQYDSVLFISSVDCFELLIALRVLSQKILAMFERRGSKKQFIKTIL